MQFQRSVKLGKTTKEAAIMLLYHLGETLPKGAKGISEIIDALGDFGAIETGLTLMEMHGL